MTNIINLETANVETEINYMIGKMCRYYGSTCEETIDFSLFTQMVSNLYEMIDMFADYMDDIGHPEAYVDRYGELA